MVKPVFAKNSAVVLCQETCCCQHLVSYTSQALHWTSFVVALLWVCIQLIQICARTERVLVCNRAKAAIQCVQLWMVIMQGTPIAQGACSLSASRSHQVVADLFHKLEAAL